MATQEATNGAFVPSARYDVADNRKFAEKPNALKKVGLDDIDEDIQTNQINDNGFSWTNMLGTLMTMFFNNAGQVGPNKSDDLDTGLGGGGGNGVAQSPWANVISVGKFNKNQIFNSFAVIRIRLLWSIFVSSHSSRSANHYVAAGRWRS